MSKASLYKMQPVLFSDIKDTKHFYFFQTRLAGTGIRIMRLNTGRSTLHTGTRKCCAQQCIINALPGCALGGMPGPRLGTCLDVGPYSGRLAKPKMQQVMLLCSGKSHKIISDALTMQRASSIFAPKRGRGLGTDCELSWQNC